MGVNDITEFLYVMLEKIGFPYRDLSLARSYDWNVIEDLKARLCTLAEVSNVCQGQVAKTAYQWMLLCRVTLRSTYMTSLYGDLETPRKSMVSGRTMRSSSLLWYDFHVFLVLLLSYVQCLFEPRVIEFEQKRAGMRFLMRAPDMAEEMVEQGADKFSERYVSIWSLRNADR